MGPSESPRPKGCGISITIHACKDWLEYELAHSDIARTVARGGREYGLVQVKRTIRIIEDREFIQPKIPDFHENAPQGSQDCPGGYTKGGCQGEDLNLRGTIVVRSRTPPLSPVKSFKSP